MAVIQISKIQVRRGAIGEQGMPQLASGEMGWAVDTQQLFIGNGSVAEGAPAVGNTEILTQYSTATINLFNCIYEYQGGKPAGYFEPYTVTRTLQNKLDEIVSVLDFGADPTGMTDSAHAIQTAVSATYINSHDSGADTSYQKILHFPAGTYIVSTTTYIPSNISIQGEGSSQSILVSINTGGNNTIFKTRSVNPATNDFLQPLTALSGAVKNVLISDLGFEYGPNVPIYTITTNSSALLNLDMAQYTTVQNCNFVGTFTNTFPGGSNKISNLGQNPIHYSGISLTGALTSNVDIDNNNFYGLLLGTYCYQDNRYVTYSNNTYDTCYEALLAGSASASSANVQGNLYNKAVNNKFLNINRVAIGVNAPPGSTTATGFVSENNLFNNVGNGNTGNEGGQITECIGFNNAIGCVSINDKFTRFNLAQTTYSTSPFLPLVLGQAITIDDKVAYRYPIIWTGTQTLIRIPYQSTMTGVIMEYQLEKTSGIRKGTFTVNAANYSNDSLSSATYTDSYNYFGTEPGVILSAKLINSTNTNLTTNFDCIAIRYQNNSQTIPGNTGTGLISLTVKYQT